MKKKIKENLNQYDEELDTSKSNVPSKRHIKTKNILKEIQEERKKQKQNNLLDVELVFGIDNGSTGTISSWNLKNNKIHFLETPSKYVLDYQKEVTYIDRIDFENLKKWFENILKETKKDYNKNNIKSVAILERPMVNPQRFMSSLKAVRAFESCLIILDLLQINYIVIDSKEWQHYFFGKNTVLINLKKASQKYGNEILEQYKINNKRTTKQMIEINLKHGDADALLISKYTIDNLLKYSKREE